MPIPPHMKKGTAPQRDIIKFDRNGLMRQLTMGGDDLELILVKRPHDLTEQEIRHISERRLGLPAGAEKEALFRFERAFFDDKFGDEPVEFDATGRLIEPRVKQEINQQPVPARTPDGSDLIRATEHLARRVADVAASEGTSDAVRFLQRGLNILNRAVTRTKDARTAADANPERGDGRPRMGFDVSSLFQDLKDDGLPGPKTRSALRTAIARLGPAKVEEALALGRFDNVIRGLSNGKMDGDLKSESQVAFGHLFRDRKIRSPEGHTEEGESLQMAINDLGFALLGRDAFKGLREDGVVGPKTQDAFKRVLAASGPNRMTDALGRNLGFFMFDHL